MKGKTLKDYRELAGATQKELARALGVSTTTIYNFENGISSPTAEHTIKALEFFSSKGLDVSINDINFIINKKQERGFNNG